MSANNVAKRIFFRSHSTFLNEIPLGSTKEFQHVEEKSKQQEIFEAVIYGLVNSILSIPCLYGYSAIIFKDRSFQDSSSALAKLVLFSSIIHQFTFVIKSTLPFAIGQVQDAGLIFLSTMATSIAAQLSSEEEILTTTLVVLSLSTFFLGLVVYGVGKLRLATLISYLPMPVIGGYLAFIGLFCFQAGLTLCSGIQINSFADYSKIIDLDKFILIFPGIFGGCLLSIISWNSQDWRALPVCMILMPTCFYLYMIVTQSSFEDVREAGWMSKDTKSVGIEDIFNLFQFGKVKFKVIPSQLVTWLSMTFVVAFSSSLDVVAIEMDMGRQLDINHELKTVGISNILSGLTGGYTGSYIFSQTIFTFRSGTNSRLVGTVVILCELLLFFAPINVMAFVPSYFFAATLIFIAVDLIFEWLFLVWFKVSLKEYMVLLGTFLFISITNDLILGIFSGILLSIVNFIFCYASVTHVETKQKQKSNIVRGMKAQLILKEHNTDITVIALHGYLFFGSTVQIINRIRSIIENTNHGAESEQISSTEEASTPLLQKNRRDDTESYGSIDNEISSFIIIDFTRVTGMDSSAIASGLLRLKQMLTTTEKLHISFVNLKPSFETLLEKNGVVESVPTGNNEILVFNDLNDAFGWAEDQIIAAFQKEKPTQLITDEEFEEDREVVMLPIFDRYSLEEESVSEKLSEFPHLKTRLIEIMKDAMVSKQKDRVVTELLPFISVAHIDCGTILFDVGDESTILPIMFTGEVVLCLTKENSTYSVLQESNDDDIEDPVLQAKPRRGTEYSIFENRRYLESSRMSEFSTFSATSKKLAPFVESIISKDIALWKRFESESFVDALRFLAKEPRKHVCFATKSSVVFYLTQKNYQKLIKQNPALAMEFNKSVLKYITTVT